jgi:SNF2 family DNA or RNA helicase
MDIQLIDDRTVRFQKKLWAESEIILAKCFGFEIDIDSGRMHANLAMTSKKSLFEFIRIAFKNFSESPTETERRNMFFGEVQGCYDQIDYQADLQIKPRLPYYDSFYDHQKQGLREVFYKKHNFLAYEMGLGKSLTSASISRVFQIPRTVIVCPAAVKWNWYRDLVKFGYNELYFTILDSSKYKTVRAFNERFVIINYDMLPNFEKELCKLPVGHFILDEAHYLKNHNSARYKNLKKVIDQHTDPRITFLSGTPITNRVNDVFAYLKLIGHELGQSHKKFLDEYTIKTTNRGGERVTGGRNLQDLHIKLSNFMIRKTKEECLDLPGKIFMSYRFEMDDYRDEYNKIIEEMSKNKDISSLTGNIHSLNIITSKAKIHGIKELAETILETGKKVVIFGSYKEPLNELEAYFGKKCVKIDGSVDSWMRDQLVQRFHNDPEVTVFLGNMKAAGVGINLTNASDVIYLNFPLSPADLYQSMDRLDRIGQVSCVNVHYTFCEDSIDDDIYDLIVDKEKDIVALIDQGREVMFRENIVETLMKKIFNRGSEEQIIGEIVTPEWENVPETVKATISVEPSVVPKEENIFAQKLRESESKGTSIQSLTPPDL